MPSPFEAAMAAADAVIGGTFGEAARVTPRIERGKAGFAQDPARSVGEIRGVFTREGASDRLGGTRQGTELQGMSTLATLPTRIWFEEAQLDALGYVPQAGDLITLTDRIGKPAYAVVKRSSTDLDDQTFPLTRERAC